MTTLDAGLRGGAIALFLVLALLGWRDARRSAAGRYGALLALCALAYVVESAPGFADRCPAWLIPFRLLSISAPAAFYLWSAAHFGDEFQPGWRQSLPWFGMMALGGWAVATDWPLAWSAVRLAALLLVAFAAARVLAGRAGDLVEGRRRFRLVLAIGAGSFIAALNLLSLAAHANPNAIAGMAGPAGVAALALGASLLLLNALPQAGTTAMSAAATAPPKPASLAAPIIFTDGEARTLFARLETMMEHDRVYREEGFGISVLAARMGIPEYRLRRLINQHLGHRNFIDFVNRYRLAEATAALADQRQAEVPILTIALDAGFQSIGPFNRAFKAHTGMTPSEFRRERLNEAQRDAAE